MSAATKLTSALAIALIATACNAAPTASGDGANSLGGDSTGDMASADFASDSNNPIQNKEIPSDTQPSDIADVQTRPSADANAAADANAGGDTLNTADAGTSDADATNPAKQPLKTDLTLPLWLDNAAFAQTPSHPSVLVFAPKGFDPTQKLQIIVYIHGHNNCVTNVLGATDSSCDSAKKTPTRSASHLAAQVSAAAKNVLLILPEVAYDMASSDPGKLGEKNGFSKFLQEVLGKLPDEIGKKTLADVATVTVASHSGGYWATASIATQGGVPIEQIWLLDSLYGSYPSYVDWIQSNVAGLSGASKWNHRFFTVYTDGGGTMALSQQLAAATQPLVPAASWLHDTTTSTWKADSYAHGLLFKHSALTHHETTLYYPQKLLETGHFSAIQ